MFSSKKFFFGEGLFLSLIPLKTMSLWTFSPKVWAPHRLALDIVLAIFFCFGGGFVISSRFFCYTNLISFWSIISLPVSIGLTFLIGFSESLTLATNLSASFCSIVSPYSMLLIRCCINLALGSFLNKARLFYLSAYEPGRCPVALSIPIIYFPLS